MIYEEAGKALPHKLTMEERQQISLSGVTEVESFDDTAVLLQTNRGRMSIRGENLQLRNLNLENGQVSVEGTVNAIVYEQGIRETGGFLRRLMG